MITRVCDDANTNSNISTVSARITREINRVCEEIWNGFRWSFRWRNYRIATDVDVTTGTLTLTNASRTITGSGTSFLSSYVGWHIYFPQDSILNWYKINHYTSSTQVELDVPYQGTSGSGKTYVLRHFDYVLPTEPWDIGSVAVTNNCKIIPILEPYSIDVIGPAPINNGVPEAVAIYSSDLNATTYSTGSITGTINTNTITGTSTFWLDNAFPGDTVTIGSYSYRIRSVDSNSQITLYNAQQVTSGSASYTITRQFGRVMRIMWPAAYAFTLDIRALRLYQPMVNNNDTNELFYRCSNAIALKVAALELKSQNDVRSRALEQDAELALTRARAEDDALTIREQVAPIHSYRSSGISQWL